MAMIAALAVLGIYWTITTARGRILRSRVKARLWLVALWIPVVNLMQTAVTWSAAVHVGLAMLWVLAYHLLSYRVRKHPGGWPQIQAGVYVLFLFYVFYCVYAAHALWTAFGRIIVVNAAYSVIVFLPWLSLMKRRERRLGYWIAAVAVLVSMKRGALIAMPMMLGVAGFVHAVVAKRRVGRLVGRMLIVVVTGLLVLWVADAWTGGFLGARFTLDQLISGSGRQAMYRTMLDDLARASPTELLLGRGSEYVQGLVGMAAHNEWLEFLFGFGVTGVVLYGLLVLALIQRMLYLVRTRSRYAPGYAMAVVYVLVVGMFGMVYFAHSTLFIMMFLGAVEGLMHRDLQEARCAGGAAQEAAGSTGTEG